MGDPPHARLMSRRNHQQGGREREIIEAQDSQCLQVGDGRGPEKLRHDLWIKWA